MGVTTLDHGDLQAIAIENDRLGGHQKGRYVIRNMKVDLTIGPGLQCAVGIRNVDFGQQRACTRLQRIGDSRHFAGESATGQLWNANDRINSRSHTERLVLRDVNLRADHVALHDGEQEFSDEYDSKAEPRFLFGGVRRERRSSAFPRVNPYGQKSKL